MTRRGFLSLPALRLAAQDPGGDFVCPMDRDIRSDKPGVCRRCGMKLVAGIPDPIDYPVRLVTQPRLVKPGAPVELAFEIVDPKSGKRVKKFEVVHEKLFHLFVVSADLQYFAHQHPVLGDDGIFRLKTSFPKSGAYRIVSDFYPAGGTPQINALSFFTSGYVPPVVLAPARLEADLQAKTSGEVNVALTMDPEQPLAGQRTLLVFQPSPFTGLEKYLGAWGHLLAASDDLIDTIHTHPFVDDAKPPLQFRLIFPREAIYRVWMQFQRQGTVHTVAFTIPVSRLK